jgi:hypothetical protein
MIDENCFEWKAFRTHFWEATSAHTMTVLSHHMTVLSHHPMMTWAQCNVQHVYIFLPQQPLKPLACAKTYRAVNPVPSAASTAAHTPSAGTDRAPPGAGAADISTTDVSSAAISGQPTLTYAVVLKAGYDSAELPALCDFAAEGFGITCRQLLIHTTVGFLSKVS